jgi:hypothetical protein
VNARLAGSLAVVVFALGGYVGDATAAKTPAPGDPVTPRVQIATGVECGYIYASVMVWADEPTWRRIGVKFTEDGRRLIRSWQAAGHRPTYTTFYHVYPDGNSHTLDVETKTPGEPWELRKHLRTGRCP